MLLQREYLTKLPDFFTEAFFRTSSRIVILMSMFGKKSGILVRPTEESRSENRKETYSSKSLVPDQNIAFFEILLWENLIFFNTTQAVPEN